MASVIAVIEIISMVVVNYRFQRDSELKVRQELAVAHRRVDNFQTLSLEKLVTLASFIAQDPRLRGSIVTDDRATIGRALDELYANYWHDLFWLLSPRGMVIARVESPEKWGDTLIQRSVIYDAVNGFDSGDLWVENGRLHQVAAVPIRSGGITIGILLLGEDFDTHLTWQFTQLAGLHLAFIGEDSLLSALDTGEKRSKLASKLISMHRSGLYADEKIPHIPLKSGKSPSALAPIVMFEVGDEPLGGALFELYDVAGQYLADGMIYRSLLPEERQLKRIQLGLFIVDIIAILLTFVAAFFISRRITSPIERLASASARLGAGDLSTPIKPEGKDEIGVLAGELEDMRSSLVKARTELIQSERLTTIGRMASSIIHDFRQPISVIYGYLDLLTIPGTKPDQVEKYKENVFKQFDRMLGMINELLEFARGEAKLNKVTTNGRRFLEEIVHGFDIQAKQQNVILSLNAEWNGDICIDAARIQRGVDNIIRNGLQVLQHGGQMAISLRLENETAIITVRDSGPGIPPEIQERLFEPFVTFGKSEGTGLGLAIAQRVITQHDGAITVESSPGAGAAFHIRLPVGKPDGST